MSLVDKYDTWKVNFQQQNKENISEAGTIYRKSVDEVLGHRGEKDHPSHPGEAPHEVTGELRESVFLEVNPVSLEATVGTRAPHGKYLIDKRPYLRIAYDKVADQIRRALLKQ